MKSFDNFVYFLYVGNNPNYSFRTYVDPDSGMERGYLVGKTDKGLPLYKEWYFNYSSKRQIRVSKEEKDLNGQLAVDFLRNSPEYYGNQNGHYVDGKQVLFLFTEINEEKTAKEAVATRARVFMAQKRAYDLKGQQLKDIASIIGVFSDNEAILQHRVLDFASNFPDRFMSLVEDKTIEIRALVKKAINDHVFTVDGKIIKWEGKVIGADEDDAVANLIKEPKLKDIIEINLKKFGSA